MQGLAYQSFKLVIDWEVLYGMFVYLRNFEWRLLELCITSTLYLGKQFQTHIRNGFMHTQFKFLIFMEESQAKY